MGLYAETNYLSGGTHKPKSFNNDGDPWTSCLPCYFIISPHPPPSICQPGLRSPPPPPADTQTGSGRLRGDAHRPHDTEPRSVFGHRVTPPPPAPLPPWWGRGEGPPEERGEVSETRHLTDRPVRILAMVVMMCALRCRLIMSSGNG